MKIAAQASRRLEPLLKKDRVVIPDTGLMGGRKTKQQEDEDTVDETATESTVQKLLR